MQNTEFEKAFDSNMNGDKRNLRVYLINPPFETPSRTIDDYKKEQEEARERHTMFQEQHKELMAQNALIAKSHKAVIASAIFSGIVALATCTLVYYAYLDILHKQESTTLQQQDPKQSQHNKPSNPKM